MLKKQSRSRQCWTSIRVENSDVKENIVLGSIGGPLPAKPATTSSIRETEIMNLATAINVATAAMALAEGA
jgi:hypothetical protein